MAVFDLSAAQVEWYPSAFSTILGPSANQIDWVGDTIKVALLSSSHLPLLDTHDFFNDVSGSEISATGYTAGGATLTGKSISYSTSTNTVSFVAANATWPTATLTAKYAVVYKSTGVSSTSPLIVLFDFGSSSSLNTVAWPLTGVSKTVVG